MNERDIRRIATVNQGEEPSAAISFGGAVSGHLIDADGAHLAAPLLGRGEVALEAPLREEGVLILGSGSSFHNMNAFRDGSAGVAACESFDDWLRKTCTVEHSQAAQERLTRWEAAPQARYAHPREEHLLPLHVCFGAALPDGRPAQCVFHDEMMGYRMSAFLWH